MSSARNPLRTVIKVKTHLEKQAHRELVEIQGKLQREAQRLDHLHRTNEAALEETRVVAKARATDLQTSRAFLHRLARQISRQQQAVEEIEEQQEQKRIELIERTQSKEIVKALEEKRALHVSKEKERKEQRLLDILAHRIRFGF